MMRTSETTGTLVKALAQAQAEMKNAPLNKTNPHFKAKYADLSAVRDATVPALAKHGLAITQVPSFSADNGLVLYTRLSHAEGEWMEAEYPLIVGNPQQMGSALTYARRYCWAAICGIAADEDDDANAASTEPPSEPTRTRATKRNPSPGSHGTHESQGQFDPGGPQPAPQLAREHADAPAATPAAGPARKPDGQTDRAAKIADELKRSGPHLAQAWMKHWPEIEGMRPKLRARLEEIRGELMGPRLPRVEAAPREVEGETYDPLPADPDDIDEAVADLEGRIEDERQEELLPR